MVNKSVKIRGRRAVAEAAGVSLTTVTHALNPPPGSRVNPETRKRVMQIATELGYRPSFVGRALVSGKSYNAGLLQPDYDSMFLSFYQCMAYGLVESAGADDYSLLLAFREHDNYLKIIQQGRIDGMVILQSDFGDNHIHRILETGLPAVILNRMFDCSAFERSGCVMSDHHGLIKSVFDELIEAGRRNIFGVIDQMYCNPNFLLFQEFSRLAATVAADGVVALPVIPSPVDFATQLGGMFSSRRHWDGIYVDGEEYLSTVLKVAAEFKLAPGRDFSLILSSVSKNLTPDQFDFPLTIYRQQPEKMGAAAWNMLQKIMCGGKFEKLVKVPYLKI